MSFIETQLKSAIETLNSAIGHDIVTFSSEPYMLDNYILYTIYTAVDEYVFQPMSIKTLFAVYIGNKDVGCFVDEAKVVVGHRMLTTLSTEQLAEAISKCLSMSVKYLTAHLDEYL